MRVLLHPVFLLCLFVFLTEQLLEYSGVFIPYIHAYADDICAMPVLLSLATACMSLVYYGKYSRQYKYRLSLMQVLFALVYCTVLFEFVLPKFSSSYISDYWDIPAYCLGAFIHYIFINPKKPVIIA